MSTYHFHRTFKSMTGVTPTQYGAAHRIIRVRASLRRKNTVTDAIYDAGFNSSGRFYETSNQVLGMTPSKFREGGTDVDIFFAIGECSLGSILVAQSKKGICSILIGDDPKLLVRELQDRFPKANLIGDERHYQELIARVVGLVEKPGVGLGLPLDIRGRHSSNEFGRRFNRFHPARPQPIPRLPRRSVCRRPCVRWRRHAVQTFWR